MCNGKYEELVKLVKKCKTNREKIPEELLQTKYKKSFCKLKGDIKKAGEAIFPELLLSPFAGIDEQQDILSTVSEIVADAKKDGYSSKLGEALVKYCDIELFCCYVAVLQCKIEEKFYTDYWVAHTQVLGGKYYNDVIDMWYDPQTEVWQNQDAFGIYWPPTKAAYTEELESRKQGLLEEISKKTSVSKVHYICA